MPQSYASLHIHVIFSTKTRRPLIVADLQPRLFEYMGGIARERGCRLIAAGGMPDHVHLLLSLSRELSIADAVKTLKANSSKWIHETFPDQRDFAWQTGYGTFAVSYSNLDQVKAYLANQEEHHRRRTFQRRVSGASEAS